MGLGVVMGVVGYRCPSSGKDVTTAIETSQHTLVKMGAMDLTLWVWCPHCMAGHQIKAADARIEREIQTVFSGPSFADTRPAMLKVAPERPGLTDYQWPVRPQ
jgi:hypothetical protein